MKLKATDLFSMKKFLLKFKSSTAKLGLLLLLLLLLPMLLYSVYQVLQKNNDEQMIRNIYARQLDTILFSINQYCWDQYRMWTDTFIDRLSVNMTPFTPTINKNALFELVNKYSSFKGSFFQLKDKPPVFYFNYANDPVDDKISNKNRTQVLSHIIDSSQEELKRLIENAESGYLKPLVIDWKLDRDGSITLILFPLNSNKHFQKGDLGGFFLMNKHFVKNILSRQMESILTENLIMGVYHEQEDRMIFTTSNSLMSPFDRRESLWLIPDHQLVIKSAGTTLEELAQKRTRLNLIFLGAVNLIVLLGIIIFLYNINQQMKLAQMKTDFVANVSHELRTPLSLIRMYAETLDMGRTKSQSQIKTYYRTIMQESQRLSQLINNILDFSKIESKRKHYEFMLIQLTDILDGVLEMYTHQFSKLNVRIEKEIQQSIPELYLDKDAITQVIINLIENAIKFSPNEKMIKIDIQGSNDQVMFCITDNGIGIPPSEQRLIFNKFYRVGSSLVHNTKGSGLGLALVKHIMQVHGGRVTVKSQLHQGSTFCLTFPVLKEPPQQ